MGGLVVNDAGDEVALQFTIGVPAETGMTFRVLGDFPINRGRSRRLPTEAVPPVPIMLEID